MQFYAALADLFPKDFEKNMRNMQRYRQHEKCSTLKSCRDRQKVRGSSVGSIQYNK